MKNSAPNRILIIGGTALLGPHVIRTLSASSEIHTLTRSGKPITFETAHTGDRRNENDMRRTLETVQPNLIIDMIPFTAQDAHLLCQLASAETPLIALSSIDVYQSYGILHGTETGPPQPCPIPETATLRTKFGPEGAAYDKIAIERIYGEYFKNLTVLRLPALYGWPDTTRVLPYLDQMLEGASEITLTAHRARFRFCRALHKNAAHAIALAARANQNGQHIYNVAEENAHSELEWAKRIAHHAGWSGQFTITPDNEPENRQHLYVDTTKIRTELGFDEIFDTDEGLAETIAFHLYEKLGKPYQKYY